MMQSRFSYVIRLSLKQALTVLVSPGTRILWSRLWQNSKRSFCNALICSDYFKGRTKP